MIDPKRIVVGAIGGFIAAVVVDLHAWGGGDPFNWKKAIARWIAGAVTGAAGAAGVTVTGVV